MATGLIGGSARVRWFTDQRELDLVDRYLGRRRWFDACLDPASPAAGRCAGGYDVRRGQDALLLGWPSGGPIFVNPPFSHAAEFVARAAAHAAEHPAHPVLLLVSAAPGTAYWERWIWPAALVCFLSPRPLFLGLEEDGSLAPSQHVKDCAFVGFNDPGSFAEVFEARGPVVRAVRSRPASTPQTGLFDHVAANMYTRTGTPAHETEAP